MRSTSNSDPVSYWQTIVADATETSTDATKLVSTMSVTYVTESNGNLDTETRETALQIRGVYCAVAGNAVLQFVEDDGVASTVDFTGLVAGAVYPFCPSRQISGGATLIALYG